LTENAFSDIRLFEIHVYVTKTYIKNQPPATKTCLEVSQMTFTRYVLMVSISYEKVLHQQF